MHLLIKKLFDFLFIWFLYKIAFCSTYLQIYGKVVLQMKLNRYIY